jgi:hypothetical protein
MAGVRNNSCVLCCVLLVQLEKLMSQPCQPTLLLSVDDLFLIPPHSPFPPAPAPAPARGTVPHWLGLSRVSWLVLGGWVGEGRLMPPAARAARSLDLDCKAMHHAEVALNPQAIRHYMRHMLWLLQLM